MVWSWPIGSGRSSYACRCSASGHEAVARHFAHRGEHARVAHVAAGDLAGDHTCAIDRERVLAGCNGIGIKLHTCPEDAGENDVFSRPASHCA